MKVLSLKEAAEIMPLSERTLRRLATSGQGPFRKRAGRWMVTEADLEEWVRTGEQGGATRMPDPMPPSRRHVRRDTLRTVDQMVGRT